MLLDELMAASGYSARYTRYERPSAARQHAVAVNTIAHTAFRRIEINALQVPLGGDKLQ